MRLSVRIPEELAERVRLQPESPSEVVRQALKAFLSFERQEVVEDLGELLRDHENRISAIEQAMQEARVM